MWGSPGTLTVLRLLTEPEQAPPGLRHYHRLQRRRARQAATTGGFSWSVSVMGSVLTVLLIGSLAVMVATGASPLALVAGLFSAENPLWWVLVAGGLGVMGLGGGLVVEQVRSLVTAEQRRQTWDLLLTLPHERRTVVLTYLAPAFSPLVAVAGFMIAEFAAVLTTILDRPSLRPVPVYLLVGAEWLQWVALGVAVGLLCAVSDLKAWGRLAPPLFGALMIGTRAGSGYLLARLAGWDGLRAGAALLAGPSIGLTSPDRWLIGLVVVMAYVLALEMLVRALIAWALARIGER